MGSPRLAQAAPKCNRRRPDAERAKSAVFRVTAEFIPLLDRFIPLFGRVAESHRFPAEFLEFSVPNPARKQPIPFYFPLEQRNSADQAASLARNERASTGALTLASLSK
jgi:hypothetical protein